MDYKMEDGMNPKLGYLGHLIDSSRGITEERERIPKDKIDNAICLNVLVSGNVLDVYRREMRQEGPSGQGKGS